MTDHTDRSAKALFARRTIAEKATPGPWWMDSAPCFAPLAYVVRCKTGNIAGLNAGEDASHIAASSPDVVMADIDEILRLRAKADRMEKWAEAECAARRHNMGIVYNILQAIDNAGLETAISKSVFEKANSLQDVADAARRAVAKEAPCPKN